MVFPNDPLDVRTELQLAGVWTDISPYVYTREPITITQGRADESQRPDPGTCDLTLNNRGGMFSPKNPTGPYYGQIGRNTPIRISVPGTESYLSLPGTPGAVASTPHVTELGITGDLDVRAEMTADWYAAGAQTLMGKWDAAADQRSWLLMLQDGSVYLRGTTAGTGASGAFFARPLPALPPRAALRATLRVDTATSTWTVTFYWARSLDGPWTQIAAPAFTAVGPSLYTGTAPVTIAPTDLTQTVARYPITGRVHRAEVRAGIGGTVVAAPDFRALAPNTGTFTDGPGRAWTVTAPAAVSNREYRFTGEVSAWPTQWDVSGNDVSTSITASGILRRLQQGNKPLDSTLRRRIPSAPSLLAYWPMEEGDTSVQAYSPLPGVRPLTGTGLDWAADDSLPGSASLPKLKNPASFSATVPATRTLGWQAELVYFLPTLPAAQTEILRVAVTGSTLRTAVVYASSAGIRIEARDADDTVLAFALYTNAGALSQFTGRWNRLQMYTADAGGGQTRLIAAWRDIAANTYAYASTIFTGGLGRATAISGTYGPATEGMALGHLSVVTIPGTGFFAGSTIYDGADDGFTGETVRARLARLAAEEARLTVSYTGDPATPTERLGPQRPAALVDLLTTCAESDGGILAEQRDALALVYRDRSSLYTQTPALVLDYTAQGEVAPPLTPVEDDQRLRNDVTVTRDGGSSGRVVITDGPLSVLPPEQGGVGIYDESVTLSLASDDQAEPIAGWRAHLGTWDGARYPTVHVQLHTAPHLIPAIHSLRIGDRIQIRNPPPWLPPGAIDALVYGYTEVLDLYTWDLTLNTVPAGPWATGVLEDPVYSRVDTDGSVVAAPTAADATSLEVHTDTSTGPRWNDSTISVSGDFPYDIAFGGEVATVTAVTNRRDDFTRTLAGTWGTSTSGQAWVEAGGLATDRSVDGARGIITLPANISTIRYEQLVPAAVTDCEVRVRMSVSAVAVGASMVPGVLLRCRSTSDFYRARIHFGVSGGMFVSVTRDTTQVGDSPALPYTYTAGAEFELRVRLAGQTIQMRVWPTGTVEPTVWHHTATITANTIDAGTIGLTASAFAGMTTPSPQLRFDAFEVVTPQLFTVTRSVNGIVKAHSAGTDVRLAVPTITAL
ncbi:hypothetical protein ACWCXE_27170 [Streptomyces sp. NPDC001780]